MKQSIAFSITLHIIIFTLFFLHFNLLHKVNNGNVPILHSYIYFAKLNSHNKMVETVKLEQDKNIKKNPIKKIDTANVNQRKASSISPSNQITANNNQQEKVSELAKKLHDLIQENIGTPNEIREFMQNKSIEISFTLYPEGKIDEVKITKSSGINVIDSLALNAIKSISPITFAKDILQDKELFKINIIFADEL